MTAYIVRRLLAVVPVLFGVSIVVFLTLRLAPGDPAIAMLGPRATGEALAQLRTWLGLDQPLHVQYLKWLSHAVVLDLGDSIALSKPVDEVIFQKFKNTLILSGASLVIAIAGGLIIGVVAASRPYSRFDRAVMGFTLVLGAIPPYLLGLLLVFLFALRLEIFPASGMYDMRGNGGPADLLHHLVLPALATAATPAAIIARMVRGAMFEVLLLDFIKVARAKGLAERTVLGRHVLKNALPPIINISGLQVGWLLGGAIFTELIFAWPGLGLEIYNSISARDYPLIQGAVLLVALVFILVNLIVDVLNMAIDPRTRVA